MSLPAIATGVIRSLLHVQVCIPALAHHAFPCSKKECDHRLGMRLTPAAAFGAGTVGGFVCGFQVASSIYSTEADRARVLKAVKVVSASFAVVLLAVGARQVLKN